MTEQHYWYELTGFQRDLLKALLSLEDRVDAVSGQDIKQQLQATHHVENINHGRLYPNLDKLVDDGLVDKTSQDDRTNNYRTTSIGEELVRREVQSWVDLLDADRQLVTDGGGRRYHYCNDCDSVHPINGQCKPLGGRDD